MKHLNPEVFVNAAIFVSKNDFAGCCYAICLAEHANQYLTPNQNYFKNLLKPEYNRGDYWFGKPMQKNVLVRQIALLLCAEILKDEAKANKRKRK